jgi:hypothetical protein
MRENRYQKRYQVRFPLPTEKTLLIEKVPMCRHLLDGAAQESNLPSVGLPRLTGFEDRKLGIRLPQIRLVTSGSVRLAQLESDGSGTRFGTRLPPGLQDRGSCRSKRVPRPPCIFEGCSPFSPEGSILQEQAIPRRTREPHG